MLNRTKGKWFCSDPMNFSGTIVCYINSDIDKPIAQLRGCETGEEDEAYTNAKLIAAAPDMYDILKDILINNENKDVDILSSDYLNKIRDILNKFE